MGWGVAGVLGSCFFAGAAFAQPSRPLPPLPESTAPPAAPAPAGSVQDVTILPPLPPPPAEPLPPPAAPTPIATPPAPPIAIQPATVAPSATTAPAPTQELKPRGLSFGLRLAVGIPLGEVFGQPPASAMTLTANNLSDEFALLFPFTVDAGYRLTPNWYVGGYFSFGFGTPPGFCTGKPLYSNECQQNDLRFGLEAKYLASPFTFIDPWIGAGVGWELANQANDAGAGHVDGPEIFHVRAGLDFDLGRHFFGGPEAMFTFATFTDAPGGTPTALHDWLMLGVSGHYDL